MYLWAFAPCLKFIRRESSEDEDVIKTFGKDVVSPADNESPKDS